MRADSLTIQFESSEGYNAAAVGPPPGSINRQNGWQGQNQPAPGLDINPAIDQQIVVNGGSAPASFGEQSWRISNAFTEGS
ncbi:MAG: hypothetical protein E6J40_02550, partial [Chloroflexi bacterium]